MAAPQVTTMSVYMCSQDVSHAAKVLLSVHTMPAHNRMPTSWLPGSASGDHHKEPQLVALPTAHVV